MVKGYLFSGPFDGQYFIFDRPLQKFSVKTAIYILVDSYFEIKETGVERIPIYYFAGLKRKGKGDHERKKSKSVKKKND